MSWKFCLPAIAALLLCTVETDVLGAKKTKSGPGKTRFGVEVSEWSSDTAPGPGIIPVGGSGQVNGDFVTAERNGIQIGIRASRRRFQNIDPLPNLEQKKVGIYLAETGEDEPGTAVWNYDIHIDLKSAFGVAKGTTLGDYDAVLDTDYASSFFGFPIPLDLSFGGLVPADTVLFQLSQNPEFGNIEFDPDDENTYKFDLILIPKTFNGPPLIASMDVVVMDIP